VLLAGQIGKESKSEEKKNRKKKKFGLKERKKKKKKILKEIKLPPLGHLLAQFFSFLVLLVQLFAETHLLAL
jgi:hypothetical protein